MKKRINLLYVCVIILVFFPGFVHGAIPAEERAALIALYNSTDGDNWTHSSGWKTPPLYTDGFAIPGTESSWHGITLSSDYVTSIDLVGNYLSGSIPPELGNLTNLTSLSLYNNQLSGSLPPELSNLSNLRTLDIGYNKLSGTIPGEIGSLSKLEDLRLFNNMLSGDIPSELGKLLNLEMLYLSGNQLTGIIPTWLCERKNLTMIGLDGNQITGTIPPGLGNLSNLRKLHIGHNQISGNIPPEFGNLSNLISLSLEYTQLSGTIPKELGNLSELKHLYLGRSELSGVIPPEVGNLSNLITLNLEFTQLSGTIPQELGNLNELKYLHLENNELNGVIPPELGNLVNLGSLRLSSNQLTGSIPLELGNLTNLEFLFLQNNRLSGDIPGSLLNLNKLSHPNVDIGSNCLYTNDSELKLWLDSVDPGWSSLQNKCGFTLTVQSSPGAGLTISVSPADSYGQGNGSTEFFRTYDIDTVVTLTAPATDNGKLFSKWLIDGTDDENRSVQIAMDMNHTAQAVYRSRDYTLTVLSFPSTGVGITVTPDDNGGNGDGNTNFTRIYESGTSVTLTAPALSENNDFVKWTVDGIDYTQKNIQVIMDNSHTAVVYYDTPPKISVDRNHLNFGYVTGSRYMPVERFTISNSGSGTLNWNAGTEMHRVGLNPESGADRGDVEVTIDPVGLSSGKFKGVIYISDSLASNSPVEVEINLWVKTQAESSPPFGEFSTPVDGSGVSSSVPVTGWALGDTGIESVKIYREDGNNLVYIGDAGFVEGARSDIETGYPGYPMNHKAGWGYMMLTHFLPNGGNGTFKIHAVATDKEGRTSTLGVKTISVDNANAVKPFGAIDTPTQGGTASGSNYRNHGWVLTPPPSKIPEAGSTINVYVDGVNLGNPVYNVYREDIAEYFPGYSNSDGAHAYFDFDTTAYANGVHTISWTAEDNAGNVDGIGSRYFTIQNSSGTSSSNRNATYSLGASVMGIDYLKDLPVVCGVPVKVKRGYGRDVESEQMFPDNNGIITITGRELDRLEIQFSDDASGIFGYPLIGNQLRSLPVGSTVDTETGTFYWQLGPGFIGQYHLVFVEEKVNGEKVKKEILVNVVPKFTKDAAKN